jgi:RING finger/CHY zinc finger protein 1
LCTHYDKKCSNFLFGCCNKTYSCHRCHNDNSECTNTINVKLITCNECGIEQNPSNSCTKCALKFSNFYCAKCFIWTSKNIHHCDKCGFCRIGLEKEIFHCEICETCFPIESKNNHVCVKIPFSKQTCPYCLESTFTSQKASCVVKCGHIVHNECLTKAQASGNYKCSICRKLLYDMSEYWNLIRTSIQLQPMPSEFYELVAGDIVKSKFGDFLIETIRDDGMVEGKITNWKYKNNLLVKAIFNKNSLVKNNKIKIYCIDCCLECTSNYHYLGSDCQYCYGYNTVKI